MRARLFRSVAVVLLLASCLGSAHAEGGLPAGSAQQGVASPTSVRLQVVCEPGDALRPAAEEIARQERTRVLDSWPVPDGGFAAWVAEPGRLSDRVVAGWARLWRDRFPQTAVGLITGRTRP